MKLKRNFFNRDTVLVAKQLLGKYLVRSIGSKLIRAKITETEAYCGFKDKASHASKGITERTRVMFGQPGFSYVYMIYGMYHCFNIVTERKGYPAAVLIRGIELPNYGFRITDYKKNMQYAIRNELISLKVRGPGKLCRELKIDRKLNGVDLCKSSELWIADGKDIIKPSQIKKAKRIGVDYAGKWKDKLWRFWID